VQQGPDSLEFRLTLSALPRRVGDIVRVSVETRNLGSVPRPVELPTCYLTLKGIQPGPWPRDRAVCAGASATLRLARGELWSLGEELEFAVPPGRYSLQVLAAIEPKVWLGMDLSLAPADSHRGRCLPADGARTKARLSYLNHLMSSSDSDQVVAREVLGLRIVGPAEVRLVTRQEDCGRAVNALDVLRRETRTVREVRLYRLGMEGYAVEAPALDAGHPDKMLYFFWPTFEYRGTESGF
jgi:hypothetical protein